LVADVLSVVHNSLLSATAHGAVATAIPANTVMTHNDLINMDRSFDARSGISPTKPLRRHAFVLGRDPDHRTLVRDA
jgi:hypothetical protein